MKRCLTIFAALIPLLFLAQPAHALKAIVAMIAGGKVQVIGIGAGKKQPIYWEGTPVTTSDKFGAFYFSTTDLPIDCVGDLSDGVSTIPVVVFGCKTEQVVGGGVSQTGQTTSYDENTPQCDDGALKEGVPLPSPRFTNNNDGTITDNLTKLIWLKNANCPKSTTGVVWQTALDLVAELNSLGTMNGNDCGDTSAAGPTHQTDWRLPNVRELQSLVDYAYHNPAISNSAGNGQGSSSDPFDNFEALSYWSSTTDAEYSDEAWDVNFDHGIVNWFGKTLPDLVTAVRGGP
jgi:hypothetical protein